mmetsp:Transcript_89151/g.212861  ORF Transcript_89151/g.212861 Transcript_89151/m.212861 type:complete len:217 (-) Transcript_89151:3518-4168(-)
MAGARRKTGPPSLENLVRQQGPASAVGVVQLVVLHIGPLAIAESHLAVLHESSVNHPLQDHEVLLAVKLPVLHLSHFPRVRQLVGWRQDGLQLERAHAVGRVRAQHLGVANELVHVPEAHLGHEHSHLFSNEQEIVHNVLGKPFEFLPQHRVLGGNAYGASVEVALAHHDAAHSDERGSGKAKSLRAQQGRNDHIPARAQLAIRFQGHAAPEAVEH